MENLDEISNLSEQEILNRISNLSGEERVKFDEYNFDCTQDRIWCQINGIDYNKPNMKAINIETYKELMGIGDIK